MRKVSRAEENYTNLNFANATKLENTEAEAAMERDREGSDDDFRGVDKTSPVAPAAEVPMSEKLRTLRAMEGGQKVYDELKSHTLAWHPTPYNGITMQHFTEAEAPRV